MTALRHVLWIGGAPGAGKTTVALRLARRHGLRWYGADTRTWQHRDRALRAGIAAALRWESMTPRQRWVDATPAAIAEGPRAESVAARRALLREANTAVVTQVRGFYARLWAHGDADLAVQEFVCECGDPGCVGTLRIRVGTAAARPVLAPGHG